VNTSNRVFRVTRGTDFDFALALLTQAGLNSQELASTGTKALLVALEEKGNVAWIFDNEGEFLRLEESIIPVG
jgi:hypothetical protein